MNLINLAYVFEHFKDGPAQVLKESLRVLKPGGLLFLIVPFNSILRRVLFNPLFTIAIGLRGHGRRMAFHEYRFSRRECRDHLRTAGFQVLSLHPDDLTNGWNRGVAVDYHSIQYYYPELRRLPDEYQLPGWANRFIGILRKLFPWSCCGGVACVARKPQSMGSL